MSSEKPPRATASLRGLLLEPSPLRSKVLRMLRFATTSGLLLGFKLTCMWLLSGHINAQLAYVLVHIVLLFVSYAMHARLSFSSAFTWRSFVRYSRAVAVIKLTDYLIFSVVFSLLKIDALWSVSAATLVVWLLRYGMVSRAFRESAESDEPGGGVTPKAATSDGADVAPDSPPRG